MSVPCDVVRLQIKRVVEGVEHTHDGIWVGTNICIGVLVWLKGDLKRGMAPAVDLEFALLYPNPNYESEFIGTMDLIKLPDFYRIWKSIPVPTSNLQEYLESKNVDKSAVCQGIDWIRAIIACMWSEGILQPALETSVLLKDDLDYVNGFVQPPCIVEEAKKKKK